MQLSTQYQHININLTIYNSSNCIWLYNSYIHYCLLDYINMLNNNNNNSIYILTIYLSHILHSNYFVDFLLTKSIISTFTNTDIYV